MTAAEHVVYLSGGVGGARLAYGLFHAHDPAQLTIVVNTADDFTHWGLSISPDLDTVMYTLAELADVARGWGLADETFAALSMVERYRGDTWFQLGDRDLATHVMRSAWLREGETLTKVTARLCEALGLPTSLLPMSDDACATMIETERGPLPFQRWLVQERALLDAQRVWFEGRARASDQVLRSLERADLVIIGPSNPYVSIDPILALPGVRERLRTRRVLAVSPIVHGQAVKGPLARMLQTLSQREPGPAAIAAHYGDLLDGIVVEHGDEAGLTALPVLAAQTVMSSRAQSVALGRSVLGFAASLGARP